MSKVAYEPISVKDALKKIRDICTIMVDLAYSSIIFNDKDLAEEVKELRELVVNYEYNLNMSLQIATRNVKDAEAAMPLFVLGKASTSLADSLRDIANVLIEGFNVHLILKDLSQKVANDLMRGKIHEGSILKGYTIKQIMEKMKYSIIIYAIKQENKWNVNPEKDVELKNGDIILVGGSPSGINLTKSLVNGGVEKLEAPPDEEKDIELVILTDNIVDYLIDLKDTSEVMVDLAYGAILYNNKELAQIIIDLGKRIDLTRNKADLAVLQIAKTATEDFSALQGLIRIIGATKAISNSAIQIANIILAELPVHPVIQLFSGESVENIFEKLVEDSSLIVDKIVTAENYMDEFGIKVLAIKHENGHYFKPRKKIKLKAGDTIIFTGQRDAFNAFQKREEKAIEQKLAEVETIKKAAEEILNSIVEKVIPEVSELVAADISKIVVVDLVNKAVSEKITDKFISKTTFENTKLTLKQLIAQLFDKFNSEVIHKKIDRVKVKQPSLNEKETISVLRNKIDYVLKKSIENIMKSLEQSTIEVAYNKVLEKNEDLIKKATLTANEKAAEEVETLIKEALKLDIEKFVSKASYTAIQGITAVEEPEKIVKNVAKEATKDFVEKIAERIMEKSGKKIAIKTAEKVALREVAKEIKKITKKAVKEIIDKMKAEVLTKELKDIIEKTAEEALES